MQSERWERGMKAMLDNGMESETCLIMDEIEGPGRP